MGAKYGEPLTKGPLEVGQMPWSMTLAYSAELTAMAAAWRTLRLSNGGLDRLSRRQFMSGSPATCSESSV